MEYNKDLNKLIWSFVEDGIKFWRVLKVSGFSWFFNWESDWIKLRWSRWVMSGVCCEFEDILDEKSPEF